jgi:hypothetical protein
MSAKVLADGAMAEVNAAVPHRLLRRAAVKLATIVPVGRLSIGDELLAIRARNNDEFNIAILACNGNLIVALDDWHDEFYDIEAAVAFVSQAILGNIRLRVDRIGGRPWRWTVERRSFNGLWIELYVNSIFIFDWGRSKDTIYRAIARD